MPNPMQSEVHKNDNKTLVQSFVKVAGKIETLER